MKIKKPLATASGFFRFTAKSRELSKESALWMIRV